MKKRSGFDPIFVLMLVVVFFSAHMGVSPARALGSKIFDHDEVNDGLAAHWKFDELGSATALDFLGANPAALQDTASLSSASLPALAIPNSGSLALDGINDYAQINAPSAALALSTSFSLTAWVRRTTSGTYDTIYDSGTQANKWWVFIADNSVGKNNALGFGRRGVLEVYSTQSIADANWHHVAVVKNGDVGNNISFYVDGAAAGTAAAGAVSVPSGSARIGALLDGVLAAQFAGNLDDLRIYSRVLSAAEVGRLASGQGCVTDGTTWANAFRELQCALSTAVSGQEIWLAGGVYRPGIVNSLNFNLINGVNLLGGFIGNETLASQRPAFDPNAVLTSLSGDLLGNDSPATFTNYAENSHTVVIAGPGVGATLDGLAIRQGNNTIGACLQIQAGAAGLTLTNVVVSGCSATGNGGGIHNQAPLTLNNVTLSGNRTISGNGGGLFSTAAVTTSNLQVLGNTAVAGGGIQTSANMIINGGLFDSNQVSTFEGGGIKSSASLDITNVNFNNNLGRFGGGAIESAGSTLTITGSNFTNNTVSIFTGGAIDVPIGAVSINSSTFTGNTSIQDGGAIFVGGGSLVVAGTTFNGNHANGGNCLPVCSSGSGGAIATIGNLTITGGGFSNNTARLDGGALAVKGGTATISQTGFVSNAAGSPADTGNPGLGRGGAIFNSAGLVLHGINATSNTAQTVGGALFSSGSLASDLSVFQFNSASSGGGLYTENGGTLLNDAFMQNSAVSQGGGITLAGGTLNTTGAALSLNSVTGPTGQGGGLFINAGTANLSSGAITSNTAANGGGLFNQGTLTTHAVTFAANTATATGGGLYNAATLNDTNSLFSGNTAVTGGGAAFAAGTSTSGHGSFTRTTFTNNTASNGGGLHSINEVSLTNATFTGNHAIAVSGDGGGLLSLGGASTLTGVTFTGNTAGRFGGGARLNAAVIQRSTFDANTAGSEGGALLLSSSSEVTASIYNANTSSLSC